MTDQYEIIPTPEEKMSVLPPVIWLQRLFYIHIASLILSLITLIWLDNPVTPWFNYALSAGTALCLLRLSPAGKRYRTAAILTALILGLTLLSKVALSTLMTLAAFILAIIASYQEFYGHSETLFQRDPKLAGRWRRLFLWQLLIGILAGFASVAATVIMVLANMEEGQIIQLIVTAIGFSGLIPGVLYLIYLNNMIKLFKE